MQILTLPQVIGCYMNCCVNVLMTIYLLSVSILLETNITLYVDVTCSRVFPITLRLNLTRLVFSLQVEERKVSHIWYNVLVSATYRKS